VYENAAEQSLHLTLGILRQSQAVFYALAFFWLDGFARFTRWGRYPLPETMAQTVGWLLAKLGQ
jgi:hypothetical protein